MSCRMLAAVAAITITLSGQSAKAQGGFLSFLDPLGLFGSTEVTDEERIENLRTRLTERGLTEAEIEERVSRIETAAATGELPTQDEILARLEERGVDSDAIEERIAAMQSGERTFDEAAIRERMAANGADEATIDARLAAFEEARATGEFSFPEGGLGDMTTADVEARMAQIQERLGAQGVDTDEMAARLEQIQASVESGSFTPPEGFDQGEMAERFARFREMRAAR